jgi:membrane-bound lytic murein transglycosylase D
VPKFIAAAYVLNFTKHAKRDKYNSISEVLIPTRVDTSFHLVKMCNYIAGPDQEDLLKLNREFIKPNTQLATNNTILLPYQYSMCYWRDNDSLIQNTLLSSYEVVSSQNASKHYSGSNSKPKKTVTTATGQSKTVHVVRSGETISSIARKYGTSVDKIMQMNNLRNSRIGVGQRLIVKNGQNHQRNYR